MQMLRSVHNNIQVKKKMKTLTRMIPKQAFGTDSNDCHQSLYY